MATARVASFGCWAAFEISQAAVPRRPMSAAMAPAPRRVANTTRRDAGRATARVRPTGASSPDLPRSASKEVTTPPRAGRDGASRTTRSLTARREGRWAAMTTVRPTMRRRTVQRTRLLGRAVEICGGLVEEEKGRIPEERPRQGDPLPLPRRQPGALGAQHGLESPGQPGHHVVEPGIADGRPNLVISGFRSAEAHVVGNGAGEEVRALRDPGHPRPPRIGVEVGQIDAADGDRATRGGNQAEQDAEQAGLATAAGTGDGHHLTGPDGRGRRRGGRGACGPGSRPRAGRSAARRSTGRERRDGSRGSGTGRSRTSKTSSAAFIPSALAW